MKSQKIILLLGGNEGNIDQTIKRAILLIEKNIGTIISTSNNYQTEAWGPIKQAPFLNIAIGIKTIFTPEIVLKKILEIEKQLGRKRLEKYGPRTIDIDILFYGKLILSTPNLIVPHPQLPFRKFALLPCVDICPNLIHPKLQKNIVELLNECKDTLTVTKK